MYNCEKCGALTRPNQPAIKVVTETRDVTYYDGSRGRETVKELKVCPACNGQVVEPIVDPPEFRLPIKTKTYAFSLRVNGVLKCTNSADELAEFYEQQTGDTKRGKRGARKHKS